MPPTRPDIEKILARSKVIAIVGLSDRPNRPSHTVAQYLQSQGRRIIPVNPMLAAPVLGETPYSKLEDVQESIDLVDIFRKPSDVPPVVDAAIAIGASCVWMQLGISHEKAARKAQAAGLDVVMNRCTAIELKALRNNQKT